MPDVCRALKFFAGSEILSNFLLYLNGSSNLNLMNQHGCPVFKPVIGQADTKCWHF